MTEKHTSPSPIPTAEQIASKTGFSPEEVNMYGQAWCENHPRKPQVPKCRIRHTNYPIFWDEYPELFQLWQDEGVIITNKKEWTAHNAKKER